VPIPSREFAASNLKFVDCWQARAIISSYNFLALTFLNSDRHETHFFLAQLLNINCDVNLERRCRKSHYACSRKNRDNGFNVEFTAACRRPTAIIFNSSDCHQNYVTAGVRSLHVCCGAERSSNTFSGERSVGYALNSTDSGQDLTLQKGSSQASSNRITFNISTLLGASCRPLIVG